MAASHSKPSPRTVGEILHWSYANLAMAHAAVAEGAPSYKPKHYAIRSRLHAGLLAGTMGIGPLADDERLALFLPRACCYCGAADALTADHIIPRARGGPHAGENLIWACRPCNTAKGAADVLVWLERRGQFPPLLLLRRYLKLGLELSAAAGVLDREPADAAGLPIDLDRVPRKYPAPSSLKLWIVPF
jgi:HNH endonuclease